MNPQNRRPEYFNGQFLDQHVLTDEQNYHLGLRRHHNISLHSWGIVDGLDIKWDADNTKLIVRPGLAIDGFGRELLLENEFVIGDGYFNLRNSDSLCVTLLYTERIEEGTIWSGTRLEIKACSTSDVSAEKGNTITDWPINLGTVQRNPTGADEPYTITDDARKYVGLVAGQISAPQKYEESSSAEIQPQITLKQSTVALLPPVKQKANNKTTTPPAPTLEVNPSHIKITAKHTTLHGNTTLRQKLRFVAPDKKPTQSTDSTKQQPNISLDDSNSNHTLRLALGNAGLKIGRFVGDDFQPALSIEQGNMIVHGNLRVRGYVHSNKPRGFLERVLTPEAMAMILAALQSDGTGLEDVLKVMQNLSVDDRIAIMIALFTIVDSWSQFSTLITSPHPESWEDLPVDKLLLSLAKKIFERQDIKWNQETLDELSKLVGALLKIAAARASILKNWPAAAVTDLFIKSVELANQKPRREKLVNALIVGEPKTLKEKIRQEILVQWPNNSAASLFDKSVALAKVEERRKELVNKLIAGELEVNEEIRQEILAQWPKDDAATKQMVDHVASDLRAETVAKLTETNEQKLEILQKLVSQTEFIGWLKGSGTHEEICEQLKCAPEEGGDDQQ